jgi:hypothetical protein
MLLLHHPLHHPYTQCHNPWRVLWKLFKRTQLLLFVGEMSMGSITRVHGKKIFELDFCYSHFNQEHKLHRSHKQNFKIRIFPSGFPYCNLFFPSQWGISHIYGLPLHLLRHADSLVHHDQEVHIWKSSQWWLNLSLRIDINMMSKYNFLCRYCGETYTSRTKYTDDLKLHGWKESWLLTYIWLWKVNAQNS